MKAGKIKCLLEVLAVMVVLQLVRILMEHAVFRFAERTKMTSSMATAAVMFVISGCLFCENTRDMFMLVYGINSANVIIKNLLCIVLT